MQKKNKKRANIFLDGQYYCGLETLTVTMHGLKVGAELSGAELDALQLESESLTAFDKAIGYVSVRMRTRAEVQRYLAGKGYRPVVIDFAVKKLQAYNYLDDQKFAATYVEVYKKKYGRMKLRQELARLGVSGEIIEEQLGALLDQEEEIRSLLQKYIRIKGAKADKNHFIKQLYGKGFPPGEVKKIADDYFREQSTYSDEMD